MIWPQVGAYMGLNVHVMCKYICNRVDLVIKGPHVQVWITIYKRLCIHYWDVNCEVWKVFGYLEGVPLFFKDLLCNSYFLELWYMLTFFTWYVLLFYYDNLSIWIIIKVLYIWILLKSLFVDVVEYTNKGILQIVKLDGKLK